jgi:hypothetical protein
VDRKDRARWARWLHLARGLSVEDVALVLDLDPGEVVSLTAVPAKYRTASEAERWRGMRAEGMGITAIARAVGAPCTTVREVLARGPAAVRVPPAPPVRSRDGGPSPKNRPILGPLGSIVKRLAALGHSAEWIATTLSLRTKTVAEFLCRLEPVRKAELARPRGRDEEEHVRANQAARAAREERRRLLTPPVGWSNGDRLATGEAAEWARFMNALQEARASGAEILGLASRVWFAPPRSRPEQPPVESAIWTGPENPHVGNPKLTPDMIAEMKVLRAQGWSTGKLAKRYGVTRATICYALLGRTFRELRPGAPSTPHAQTPPRLAPAPVAKPAREEHPQLILPSPAWSKGAYFLTGEQREWEQFQAATAEARERGEEIIGAHSDIFPGPYRARPNAPPLEPALWTGPSHDDEPDDD